MNRSIVFGALVAMGLGMLLAAQSADDSLRSLVAEISRELETLTKRVDQLEHASGAYRPSATPTSSTAARGQRPSAEPAAPPRTMVVDAVHQAPPSDQHAQRIAQLQSESASLNAAMDKSAVQSIRDGGTPERKSVRGSGWDVHTNISGINSRISEDEQLTKRYGTLHAIKQQQIKRLQAADEEPHQVILGHDGKLLIRLQTRYNLSKDLDNIPLGATVTWQGQRLSADEHSETWEIERIRLVSQ